MILINIEMFHIRHRKKLLTRWHFNWWKLNLLRIFTKNSYQFILETQRRSRIFLKDVWELEFSQCTRHLETLDGWMVSSAWHLSDSFAHIAFASSSMLNTFYVRNIASQFCHILRVWNSLFKKDHRVSSGSHHQPLLLLMDF